MAETKCGHCSTTIKSREKAIINCTLCECKYHTKCVNLREEDIRYLQESKNIKFICNYCSNSNIINDFKDLKKMLELCINTLKEHNGIIEQHGQKIDNLIKTDKINNENKMQDVRQTYVNVAKKGMKEAVVIKPINEDQRSNKTQEEIAEKIDPSKLGLRIENVKNISKGGIVVNCSNADSKSKLKNKMEEELGNKYRVEDPKMKNPKIKINGAEIKFINRDDKVIIQDLIEQNSIKEEGKIKMKIIRKYEKKGRRNYGIIIVEVEPKLFRDIIQRGKLNAGWRECNVEEYFGTMQCFKCARFNHLAKDCENVITCFKCAGNHKTDTCDSNNLKCTNCVITTDKLKIKLDFNHTAFDQNCPCRVRQIDRIIERTNYHI